MATCPNKNLKSWKDLYAIHGNTAYYYWDKYEGSVPDEYYQKAPEESVQSKVDNFLAAIGVSVERLNAIKDRQGNPLNALAKADMLNKIIQVVQDKEDYTTLPEEAAHFFVEMLGENHFLYQQMLKDITSYEIYKTTVAEYKNNPLYRNPDGTVNFSKIKKEAMGKLIAQHITDPQSSKPELKNWFTSLLGWIKSIFLKSKNNPFQTAADKIVNADISDLGELISTEEYLQTGNGFERLLVDQQRIQLDDSVDSKTGEKKHIYTIDGKPIVDKDGNNRSVSSVYVNAWYKKKFPTDRRDDNQKKLDAIKAEEGTKIHEDMENIINRFFDEKGDRRATALPKGTVVTTDEVYTKLEEFFMQVMAQHTNPSTKFLSEVKLYDSKKNVAGTIDLLIVEPDGTAHLYDWKSQEIHDKQSELKWFKPEAYRIQLGEYKKILMSEYGIMKFGKVRAVPIKTMFDFVKNPSGKLTLKSVKDIEIGHADPTLIPKTKNYLLPVVLRDESTGDESLDKLIHQLNGVYQRLYDKKVKASEKEFKASELNELAKAIRDLQVRRDITTFVQNGNSEAKKFKRKLSDGSIGINEITEAIDIVTIYEQSLEFLSPKIEEISEQIKNSKDVDEITYLEEVMNDYQDMRDNSEYTLIKLKSKRKELGVEIAKSEGIMNLLGAEKALDFLKRTFRSLSTLDTSALRTFYKMLRRAQVVRNDKIDQMNEDLTKLKNDLEAWSKSKGLTGNDMFRYLLDHDDKGKPTGAFIKRYNPEFFTKRDIALANEDVKWFRENTDFDKLGYTEGLAAYKNELDERYPDPDEQTQKRKEELLDRWIDTHSEGSKWAYLNKSNYYIKPKSKWNSNEYNFIHNSENEPLLRAYEYFQGMIRHSTDLGMLDKFSARFIPSVHKSMVESVVNGDMKNLFSTGNLLESLSVDAEGGFGKIDPLTGLLRKDIPVYYTNDLGENKSLDLFRVFSIWGNQMYNYEVMSDIEAGSEVLLQVEKSKQSLATDNFGRAKPGHEIKNNDTNAAVLEKFINYYVYGQKMGDGKDKSFTINGKTYSATKSAQSFVRFFTFKTLALNPLSGTATFVGGTGNAFFQASKRLVFNEKEWANGLRDYTSRDKVTHSMLHYFGIGLEDMKYKNSRNLSVSEIMKTVTSDKLMFVQRYGDQGAVDPVGAAMFRTNMVDESGNIVNIRDYVKSKNNYETIYNLSNTDRKTLQAKIEKEVAELQKTKSLKATATIVDDKLVIPGVERTSETAIQFRAMVQKTMKNVIGNASHEDINAMRMTIMGQALMQFRSWMPQMMIERFGDMTYDEDLESYQYGKARLFLKHFMGGHILNKTRELITGFGTDTIERAKERYREFQIQAIENGTEFKMTEAEFIDMYIGNLRSMMRELLVMVGFASLLFWGIGGDDDDKTGLRKYWAKALQKYHNEFSFYYVPTNFTDMIKSPIPVVGAFMDFEKLITHGIGQTWSFSTGDEAGMKKNKPAKYLAKMLPITKEFQNIYAAFDEDFARDWGIK